MPFMHRASWGLLLLSTVICVAAFAYPMLIIQPFEHQDPGQLAVALQVRRWGPWVALCFALLASYSIWTLWSRHAGRWARTGISVLGVLALAGTVLAHINVFEIMFHPIDAVTVVAADQAKLENDDMVLAVSAGGQARAYPIRMMAYHHVVNDWVGGVPLAGTY
jgi:hypothetical protein